MHRFPSVVFVCLFVVGAMVGPVFACPRIAGDSLAVGIAQAMHCPGRAVSGISTARGVAMAGQGSGLLVFSGGSNDGGNVAALDQLKAGNSNLVIVLPAAVSATAKGRAVDAAWASRNGVRTIGFVGCHGGFHPCSYGGLVAALNGFR